MDRSLGDSAGVYALRLGLEAERVRRFRMTVTLEPETLVLRRAAAEPAPLILCLHPARMTEFQFAHALRGLVCLQAHFAFPRGLHAHEVDLGGARTVGYAWYHYTGDNPAFHESLDFATDYLDRILEKLRDGMPIDTHSLYVLGAGEGASMAAVYAARHANWFAGVIALGGQIRPEILADYLPGEERVPFLWISAQKERGARGVRTEDICTELREVGFSVDFEQLPGDGESWSEEEGAVISWLSQKAGIPVQQPT